MMRVELISWYGFTLKLFFYPLFFLKFYIQNFIPFYKNSKSENKIASDIFSLDAVYLQMKK